MGLVKAMDGLAQRRFVRQTLGSFGSLLLNLVDGLDEELQVPAAYAVNEIMANRGPEKDVRGLLMGSAPELFTEDGTPKRGVAELIQALSVFCGRVGRIAA